MLLERELGPKDIEAEAEVQFFVELDREGWIEIDRLQVGLISGGVAKIATRTEGAFLLPLVPEAVRSSDAETEGEGESEESDGPTPEW